MVRAERAAAGRGARRCPGCAGDTQRGLGLDRSAGYFRALVALCEPRLRDPGSDAVASAGEIARRLTASGQEQGRVSQKAVERRLANVRQRLGIGAARTRSAARPPGWSCATRPACWWIWCCARGTVTRADLALLDPGVRSG